MGKAMTLAGGRGTSGCVTAECVVLPRTFTFFGNVNWDTGSLVLPGDPMDGVNIAGKVFIFKSPSGGQGTAWKIAEMVQKGTGPAAIVVWHSNPILVSGCVFARIPLVADLPTDPTAVFSTGDVVTVDAANGEVRLAEAHEG